MSKSDNGVERKELIPISECATEAASLVYHDVLRRVVVKAIMRTRLAKSIQTSRSRLFWTAGSTFTQLIMKRSPIDYRIDTSRKVLSDKDHLIVKSVLEPVYDEAMCYARRLTNCFVQELKATTSRCIYNSLYRTDYMG